MNKDRFKFRVPFYCGEQGGDGRFLGFTYFEAGRHMIGMIHPEMPKKRTVITKPAEQSTGLRDRNGNLIYIGDIVAIKIKGLPDDIRTVEYDGDGIDGIYPFNLYHDCGDDCHCKLRDFPESACEIIGNIHEQKEQK